MDKKTLDHAWRVARITHKNFFTTGRSWNKEVFAQHGKPDDLLLIYAKTWLAARYDEALPTIATTMRFHNFSENFTSPKAAQRYWERCKQQIRDKLFELYPYGKSAVERRRQWEEEDNVDDQL